MIARVPPSTSPAKASSSSSLKKVPRKESRFCISFLWMQSTDYMHSLWRNSKSFKAQRMNTYRSIWKEWNSFNLGSMTNREEINSSTYRTQRDFLSNGSNILMWHFPTLSLNRHFPSTQRSSGPGTAPISSSTARMASRSTEGKISNCSIPSLMQASPTLLSQTTRSTQLASIIPPLTSITPRTTFFGKSERRPEQESLRRTSSMCLGPISSARVGNSSRELKHPTSRFTLLQISTFGRTKSTSRIFRIWHGLIKQIRSFTLAILEV